MEKKSKVIIIKKVKKGHGEHHGGSWKVAYADFVTAMMAFFLLMWLLSMVAPEKRAVMSLYFKNFALFDHGGKSFMMEGGVKPAMKSGGQEFYETQEEVNTGFTSQEEMKGSLLAGVEKSDQSIKGNILVDVSEVGVRLQIVDKIEHPIFQAGSAVLTEDAKKVLKVAAATMRDLPNAIVIEGHTDASFTRNEQISNWELSTLRACAARRELEMNGIDPFRIDKVAGYADKIPLIKDNPADARNRRVSIVFLFNKKKHKPIDPYDWVWSSAPTAIH
jgi:chemotaxis protein MotB